MQHARRLAGLVVLAAIFTFCLVQDAETSAGVGRYLTAQRAALAGRGPGVTVDEIMRPAIAQSVREGLLWGGAVLVSGVGIAAAVAARGVVAPERVERRLPDPGAGQL